MEDEELSRHDDEKDEKTFQQLDHNPLFNCMLYSVKVISNNTQENPVKKVFFVIKKKNCKKAVDRNRVKRIARNAFRDACMQGDISLSKTLIFFLERDMIREEYSKIVHQMTIDLQNIFKKPKY